VNIEIVCLLEELETETGPRRKGQTNRGGARRANQGHHAPAHEDQIKNTDESESIQRHCR
jgi:hypothetical protein